MKPEREINAYPLCRHCMAICVNLGIPEMMENADGNSRSSASCEDFAMRNLYAHILQLHSPPSISQVSSSNSITVLKTRWPQVTLCPGESTMHHGICHLVIYKAHYSEELSSTEVRCSQWVQPVLLAWISKLQLQPHTGPWPSFQWPVGLGMVFLVKGL